MSSVWFIHIYETENQRVPTDFRIKSVLLNGVAVEKKMTRSLFESGVYTIVFDGQYCGFFKSRFEKLIQDVSVSGSSISFSVVGTLYYQLE